MKRLNIEVAEEIMKDLKVHVAEDQTTIKIFLTGIILEALHKKKENKNDKRT